MKRLWISMIPPWWYGTVTIMVEASTLPLWLTDIQREGFHLQRFQYPNEKKVTFQIPLPVAPSLVRLLRRKRVRPKIVKREGWPSVWKRLWQRKIFCFGAIASVTTLWGLFSIIWFIDIEGDTSIPPVYIRALLHREGIYVGQFRQNISDPQKILHRIQLQLPGVAWIGMRMEGIGAIVTVVEKRHIDNKVPKTAPMLDTQGDIVAKRSALVTEILTERGTPLVDVQDVVVPGQVLISGAYEVPDSSGQGSWVGARGRVMGEVWYTTEVEVPLRTESRVYTGRRQMRVIPYLLQKALRWPGWEFPYAQRSIRQRLQPIHLGPWELPFGWVEEEYWEMTPRVQKFSPSEAVQIGYEQACAAVEKSVGPEGRVLEGKILHQHVERGKVVVSVHFDATENIAVSQS